MDRTMALVLILMIGGAAMVYRSVSHRASVAPPGSLATTTRTNIERPQGGAAATPPRKGCSPSSLRLEWPLHGSMDKDFFIANYFDEDPAAGHTRDYTGARDNDAITYDAHAGLDIELSSFRPMDEGTAVYASAAGVVVETFADSFDRNMTCTSDKWNFVKIRHSNGFSTIYGHLRKGSVIVKPGQQVLAGTALAQVGSSGCSGYPHLHLEVEDCDGRALDVIKENMFIQMPGYAPKQSATLMETLVRQPVLHDVGEIQDPGSSDTSNIVSGEMFSVAMTVSHLKAGDVIRIDFINPLNEPAAFSFERAIEKSFPRSHWWSDFSLEIAGSWLVQFKINGRVQGSRRINVN